MLKKLMVRTWFGELPPWSAVFFAHVTRLAQFGWNFRLITDYRWFADEVRRQLGFELPSESKIDRRKAGDWDPFLGIVLQKELRAEGYDYWGHYNLDAVYGRLERWVPDNFLENLDIFAMDPGAICGPFTVYRNTPWINHLCMDAPRSAECLESPQFMGWDETEFNSHIQKLVLAGRITMATGFFQSHDHIDEEHRQSMVQRVRLTRDGTLFDEDLVKEIAMFHFNKTRIWPVG